MRLTNAECEKEIEKVKPKQYIGWIILGVGCALMFLHLIFLASGITLELFDNDIVVIPTCYMLINVVGIIVLRLSYKKANNYKLTIKLNDYYEKLINAGYTHAQAEIEIEKYRQREELLNESRRIRRRMD